MVTFSFRKFIKCVESYYATCETYLDNGWIEQRSGSGSDDDDYWKVVFKTEFDRQGLFRFEWRDQTDVFTQQFPNLENVVWANKYGAFGRFDFEENTHHFLDLAQALDAASVLSSGVAPLVAAMLYPELRNIFERPTVRRRPTRVELLERNNRELLSVVWQRQGEMVIVSRQVLFDVNDFVVREIYETARKLAPMSSSKVLTEAQNFTGVLGSYLSTSGSSGRGLAGDPADLVFSTKIVFENVCIAPSNLALLQAHPDIH